MPDTFVPISLDGRPQYLACLAACPEKPSDYSFANIWGWCEEYGLEWAFGHSHVWLRQTRPQVVHWAPIGPWTTVDWSACPILGQKAEDGRDGQASQEAPVGCGNVLCGDGDGKGPGQERSFIRVPEQLAAIWHKALPGRVTLTESREHWDYIYSVPELVKLSGNRFHKKKNLLSQFMKTYAYDYRPLTADCIEEVLQMQLEWCQWREDECDLTLEAENRAIARVVKDWDRLPNLLGGAIRVEGRMIAYTVAEPLDDSMLVIHFEKGHTGFKGVYQAINQMFLEQQGQNYQWVNREQDLGDEGLRKAKTGYNPAWFMKKFAVSVGA